VTERDVLTAVVVVVRDEGRERDEAETPARLLKRQTPRMETLPTNATVAVMQPELTEKGDLPPTICLRKKEVETLPQKN
jgi:hypothetical protein